MYLGVGLFRLCGQLSGQPTQCISHLRRRDIVGGQVTEPHSAAALAGTYTLGLIQNPPHNLLIRLPPRAVWLLPQRVLFRARAGTRVIVVVVPAEETSMPATTTDSPTWRAPRPHSDIRHYVVLEVICGLLGLLTQ